MCQQLSEVDRERLAGARSQRTAASTRHKKEQGSRGVYTSRSYEAIKSVRKSEGYQAVLDELVREPEPFFVTAADSTPNSTQEYHTAPMTHAHPTLLETDVAGILADHDIAVPGLA